MNIDEQYDAVLRLLAEKPLRMADVVRETGLSEAQVRLRLRTLRKTGEVVVVVDGKDWLWKRVWRWFCLIRCRLTGIGGRISRRGIGFR